MRKNHKRIVDEIVEEYKEYESTLAINLFGSLATEKERKDSDVDIEIISEHAQNWELKQDEERYGIKIDLVICPKKHLLNRVDKYPYLCYAYLSEKIIYDPFDFMAGIKKKLKKYFDENPEIVKFWEKKLKVMNKNKAKGQDSKDAMKSYDEAERLFSKEHKVTREFFREN